jgi:ATP-dependent Clp protease adaptor protein ClpS
MKLVNSKPKTWLNEVEEQLRTWKVVLYNDDENSFEDVIVLLVLYCQHDESQAEQCALIVHTNGKYAVKEGSLEEMTPIANALSESGLTVDLE